MRRGWGIFVFILIAAAAGWWWYSRQAQNNPTTNAATTAAGGSTLRVTLLNLRLPLAKDGDNAWPLRSDLAIDTLKQTAPDIIALQECSGMQTSDLANKMPEYAQYPDERDGDSSATYVRLNFTLIMYRKGRFDAIDYSNGTVREGAPADPQITAYYSMVILRDRTKTLPDLIIFDTHIRHNYALSIQDGQALNNRITAQTRLHKGAQAILLGDMNFDKNSAIYAALTGAQPASATRSAVTPLLDTYDYSQMKPGEKWGSYHAFTGQPAGLWPTDFVFVSGGLAADPARVLRQSQNGKYPSDHFPVTVNIRVR